MTAIAIESARLVERLRERDRFFDLAPEIFCIFNPGDGAHRPGQSDLRVASPATRAEELTSRHYLEFVHPDDRRGADGRSRRAAMRGRPR